MQLHQLHPKNKLKKRKRIGRGGKKGAYSGRGIKGQKSRAGAKIRPAWRDLIKRLPKQRGVKFKSVFKKPLIINLADLEKKFREGEIVSSNTLLNKGLITKIKGRIPEVKILGEGEITKKIEIQDCRVSKSAKEKIEEAGGTVKSKIKN